LVVFLVVVSLETVQTPAAAKAAALGAEMARPKGLINSYPCVGR
jgi:hypothetical protein